LGVKEMRAVGWLLDAYVDGEGAVLWFKLKDGSALKLRDAYSPDFYLKPKEEVEVGELEDSLSSHPLVRRVEVEKRFLSLDRKTETEVLHVWVGSVRDYRRVLRDLKECRVLL